ncbi:hypothetical protein Csa_020867 [Cucumis sativus]|uniref:Uncharacterized protein n=1 Tax=Cucumis sativus TaxID=3659 RepID=A0A0A0KAK1_CUCSA|nr:hypothetical protein Csa_020867 [Cucumis sativus]
MEDHRGRITVGFFLFPHFTLENDRNSSLFPSKSSSKQALTAVILFSPVAASFSDWVSLFYLQPQVNSRARTDSCCDFCS